MSDPEDTASFKIALISDSHIRYNDLQDVVNAINSNSEIKFILHGGDMTDGGILAEFLLFQAIMQQLKQPYFTVIGNHDCLASGLGIYEDMFGPEYYSFVAGNCKFIFFNDVIWELQFREPDYFWLRNELVDNDHYSHVFVLAHIAPYSDSFTPLQEKVYSTILDTNNVRLSIHGHHHDHGYSEHYHDGVLYMTIGAVAKRYYVTLAISPDTVIMERIGF
jgi:predicted phosphodiesterase